MHVTFLVSPRNVTQRRRPEGHALRLRLRVPCASRPMRPLRNSPQPCGLGLKQSSRTSPHWTAMLGVTNGTISVVARAPKLGSLGVGSLLPTDLTPWPDGHPRISFHFIRATKTTRSTSRSGSASQTSLQTSTSAACSPTTKQRIEVHDSSHHHGRAPVRSAEHRRLKRGCRRGLSERPKAASSAAAASTEKRREPAAAGGGRVSRVAFSLDTFFWRSKSKVSRPRDELPLNINARQRTTN